MPIVRKIYDSEKVRKVIKPLSINRKISKGLTSRWTSSSNFRHTGVTASIKTVIVFKVSIVLVLFFF